MKKYGLDASALTNAIGQLLGRDFDIADTEFEAARLDTVHSAQKAEAL
jgi:transketolase